MATWGAHIRIAEALLQQKQNWEEVHFLVGNIGPDCGMPNEDWSEFSPPKSISHWWNTSKEIEPEQFYEAYLQDALADQKRYSFLTGYYIHLLTDVEWSKMMKKKMETDEGYQRFQKEPSFIWKIKEDWYDLDHLYFRKNPESIFHRVFRYINNFPDYLEYYPTGAVERQVKYIGNFYASYDGNPEREYVYLTESEMDIFVQETVCHVMKELKKKQLIRDMVESKKP